MSQLLVQFLIYWAVFGLIIGLWAKWKNRNGILWAILGGPFMVLGILIIIFMPFLCPKCRKKVKRKQWKKNICPDCGSNLKTGGKVFRIVIKTVSISAVSIVVLALATAIIMNILMGKSSQKSSNYAESEAFDPEVVKIIADAIKENVVKVSFDDLARYPDKFIETPVHLTGKIIQKISPDQYRVNITKTEYSWTDTIYIILETGERLLEDDEVDFYGLANGTITYETVIGDHITIPRVDVYEIKLLKEVKEVVKPIEMDIKTVKENAVETTYDDLARYPDKMKRKPVYLTGKIVSKISKDRFKAQITKRYNYGFSYWEDEIIIRLRTDARLLEKDIVEFYGVANGMVDDSTPLVEVCEINVIWKDGYTIFDL